MHKRKHMELIPKKIYAKDNMARTSNLSKKPKSSFSKESMQENVKV